MTARFTAEALQDLQVNPANCYEIHQDQAGFFITDDAGNRIPVRLT